MKKYDVQKKVKAYGESEIYLKNNAEPMVKREVRKEYENRYPSE